MNIKILNNLKKTFRLKKVLVTGHTGFKGTWLCYILKELNANISGISLKPKKTDLYSISNISKFVKSSFIDINDLDKLKKSIKKFEPDFIFHLAAQPLVIKSYNYPYETFSTNVGGTLNLLESVRDLYKDKNITLIIITTDKVYKDQKLKVDYSEEMELGGFDPYSTSKVACEILCESYCKSFFSKNSNIKIATARAGNVIGGGDFSENRIIPDIVRSFKNTKSLKVRMPQAFRPWQHVLEPLFGYLRLAEFLNKKFDKKKKQKQKYMNFNFGPRQGDTLSVKELIDLSKNFMKKKNKVEYTRPKFLETEYLMLSINKSKKILNWSPIWNSKKSIEKSILWYKDFIFKKKNPTNLIIRDIFDYINEIKKN